MSIEAMKLAAEFNRYFTSANGVDVPAKVSVSRDEWRALFTAIQQAEAQQPATGVPVMDVRCEGCGYMTHHREHMGCVRAAKQHTHPAPSVPADVVRDAERYRWLADCNNYEAGLELIIDPKLTAHTLGEKIDAAMLAAKKPSA